MRRVISVFAVSVFVTAGFSTANGVAAASPQETPGWTISQAKSIGGKTVSSQALHS
ncbi:hypothetical protein [Amycolatopsis sp. NPDC051371]|uniref:hypothetical protein n=1 Tax=Amycolatopsis sp. NPDC051371 TaxID=3155800 RepID=UPI00341B56E5